MDQNSFYESQFPTFINFFPKLKYYFTKDPVQFNSLAYAICRHLFKFQSISQKEMSALYSLFGSKADFEGSIALLKKDKKNLEMGFYISQLLVSSKSEYYIHKFIKSQAFKVLCKEGNLESDEVQYIMKLGLKCLNIADLD